MDPTYLGLLRAILCDPADDTPRLVLADRLDDRGEAEHAEFIRVQVRIAEMVPKARFFFPPDPQYREIDTLRRRERELLDGVCGLGVEALPVVEGLTRSSAVGRGNYGWYPRAGTGQTVDGRNGIEADFRRGFVAAVTCTAAAWLEYGEAIVAAAPVEQVTLSDKRPYEFVAGRWWWLNEHSPLDEHESAPTSRLPYWLWRTLNPANPSGKPAEWTTEADAIAALSAACLAWARERAGLPAPKGALQP